MMKLTVVVPPAVSSQDKDALLWQVDAPLVTRQAMVQDAVGTAVVLLHSAGDAGRPLPAGAGCVAAAGHSSAGASQLGVVAGPSNVVSSRAAVSAVVLAEALLLPVLTSEDGGDTTGTTSTLSGRLEHLRTAVASWAGILPASGAEVSTTGAVEWGAALLVVIAWPSGTGEVSAGTVGSRAELLLLSPAECMGSQL
jgi:hypothetical protein